MEDGENGSAGPVQENGSEDGNRAKNKTVLLAPNFTRKMREILAREREGEQEESLGYFGGGYSDWDAPQEGGYSYHKSNVAVREEAPNISQNRQRVSDIAPEQSGVETDQSTKPAKNLPPIVGFLVSYEDNPSGEVHELRVGRWILSSARVVVPGTYIVIRHESISPVHATLRIDPDGAITILDQFSEHGTGIRRGGAEVEEAVTMTQVRHGDILRFGRRSFFVCTVWKKPASGEGAAQHSEASSNASGNCTSANAVSPEEKADNQVSS